jgi:TolB-like protein
MTGAAERPRVVVLDVTSFDATTARRASELAELALTELSRSGRLEVIGTSDVTTMLGLERQKTLLGCTQERSCMAEIGAALGAPYLVAGSVGSSGSLLRVDLKLIEVSSSKVIAREGQVIENERDWYTLTAAMFARLEAAVPGLDAAIVKPTAGRAAWPFVVAGAGALVGLGGGALMVVGAAQATDALEQGRAGAVIASDVSTRYDAASTLHTVGVGLLIGGAAVAATGVVLAFVTGEPKPAPVSLAPVAGGAQLTFQGTF